MTEQEYSNVVIKSHLRAVQKLLGEAKSYPLTAKHDYLLTNAYNNVCRVIESLGKKIKIEQAEEVKK